MAQEIKKTETINKIINLLKGLTQKEAQELLDKTKDELYNKQLIS